MEIIRLKEFEEKFETEEIVIYVLINHEPGGGVNYKDDYFNTSASTYTVMNCKTMTLDKSEYILEMLVPKNTPSWGYGIKQFGIYKFLVKKAKVDPNKKWPWHQNRYLVLDILENDENPKELESMAVYLKQPKIFSTSLGDFHLSRKYDWYELECSGYNITLEVDKEAGETCEGALNVFKQYEKELKELDNRLKKYAAEELLETVNEWDWLEKKWTMEEFIKCIFVTSYEFYKDGSLDTYYDADKIEECLCIIVKMDENGNLIDALMD